MLEIKSQERKLPQRDLLQLLRLHWSPSSCSPFPHHCLMCLSGLFFGLLRAKRVLHVISFSSLFPSFPLSLLPPLPSFFVLTTKKSVLGQKVNVPQARTDQPEKRKKTETQTKSFATHLSITIHTQSTCVGNGNWGVSFNVIDGLTIRNMNRKSVVLLISIERNELIVKESLLYDTINNNWSLEIINKGNW